MLSKKDLCAALDSSLFSFYSHLDDDDMSDDLFYSAQVHHEIRGAVPDALLGDERGQGQERLRGGTEERLRVVGADDVLDETIPAEGTGALPGTHLHDHPRLPDGRLQPPGAVGNYDGPDPGSAQGSPLQREDTGNQRFGQVEAVRTSGVQDSYASKDVGHPRRHFGRSLL